MRKKPVKIKIRTKQSALDPSSLFGAFSSGNDEKKYDAEKEERETDMINIIEDIISSEKIQFGIPTEEELNKFCSPEENIEDEDEEDLSEDNDYLSAELDNLDNDDVSVEDLVNSFIDKLKSIYSSVVEESGSEFETKGFIDVEQRDDGKINIVVEYDSYEMSNLEAVTKIRYNPEDKTITTSHEGKVNTVMVYEKGERHFSTYSTPFGIMEMAVYTKECRGRLLYPRGGVLFIDYTVEVKGLERQHTYLTIEVLPCT